MKQAYLPVKGDGVSFDDLTFPKAQELTRVLMAEVNPFARLLECRASSDGEVVVLEVEVELPQRPTHDIRRHERLAVTFYPGDQLQPEVLALRSDFPLVPHLNLRDVEFPRSLCLYDRPYHEVKLHWTAATFLEELRNWLAQTAKGQLHGDDQPLEPLLFDAVEDLVLPEDLLAKESGQTTEWLTVRMVPRGPKLYTLIASRWEGGSQDNLAWVALMVSCAPQMHGVIRHTPRTVADLHGFTAACGLDLVDTLRRELGEWMQRPKKEFRRILEASPILVVRLPKTREPGGKFEVIEARAFLATATIEQLGVDVGVWELNQNKPGLLLEYDEAKRGIETSLVPLNPRPAFSRSLAAHVNGLGDSTPMKVASIGIGALGSQIITNLVRAGFGQWTLVDDDVLLPHNLGRHALGGFAVGYSKALALTEVLNSTIEGEDVARGIVADVLRPGEDAQLLQSALSETEVILDMSASVSVARHLCRDVETEARRVSLFLNPSGTALTMLAEDTSRQFPLDVLEMQFYREIVANPGLNGLLESGGQLRTGQSCRDVSAQIPQHLVALHAAIGSQAFRETVGAEAAQISTWRVDPEHYTVSVMCVNPAQPRKEIVGDWTLYTDARLLERLSELRRGPLPKETGGVLVGAYDVGRKIIYIVETVPSPPDSEEWPMAYIRGSSGLTRRVQEITEATDGMLRYVGEWHSHPDGSDVAPSPDDQKVLAWVGEIMGREGLPGVMAIVGDEGTLNLLLTPKPR